MNACLENHELIQTNTVIPGKTTSLLKKIQLRDSYHNKHKALK